MEKTDVFVWVDGEDGAGASLAVRSLKAKLKLTVGGWFLLGTKSERLERIAYDLGMRAMTRPADLSGVGPIMAGNGDSPSVLLWSAEAVLCAEWAPWQGIQVRLWPNCPAAFLLREDLPGVPGTTWTHWQGQTTLEHSPLPENQVKVLESKEFEKAAHGGGWPFGPAVIMLDKPAPRR